MPTPPRAPRATNALPRILVGTLLMLVAAAGTWAFTARNLQAASTPTPIPVASASVHAETLGTYANPATCEGGFVPHLLEHRTEAQGDVVRYYDSNGSGIASSDLDRDGDIDLVLANLNGRNTVAWNEGGFVFREEALSFGGSRGVAVLDLDGDGGRDLVFTQGYGSLLVYRDDGGDASSIDRFERSALRGVSAPAYAMDWADVDLDGDLDVLTGSYDSMVAKDRRDSFLFGRGGGVSLYLNQDERFQEIRLADASQALAVALADVNGDGYPDAIVGNDFAVPDATFLNPGQPGGPWTQQTPFPVTTRNTMSFDLADVNRDGRLDLFATDMKPTFQDPEVVVSWLPLLDDGYHEIRDSENQIPENVLLQATPNGAYRNVAYRLGIDATGWSWSGRFADFNLDGVLDLYVVNGMIAQEAFPHLPGHALVETNKAFRGTTDGLEPADDWGLGDVRSSRGLTIADIDNDGDLDLAINTLEAHAVVYENRTCRGGHPLAVELAWPGSGNPDAVGSVVTLAVGTERYTQPIRVTAGYLSGGPSTAHFGLPAGAEIDAAWVAWPDGTVTRAHGIDPGTRVRLTRIDPDSVAMTHPRGDTQ